MMSSHHDKPHSRVGRLRRAVLRLCVCVWGVFHSQRGFSSTWVDVGGGSPVVIYEVRNAVDGEPHLPTLGQRLFIQQTAQRNIQGSVYKSITYT